MNRAILTAATLALLAGMAVSATPSQSTSQPTEIKIISAPPAQPTEVKIVATPPAVPFDVNVKSIPPDESAPAMVQLTKWVVIANIALCLVTVGLGGVTVWSTRKQSRDLKNRDLTAMRRELSGSAQRVMTMATRVDQMNAQIAPTRRSLHSMLNQAVPPAIQMQIDEVSSARHFRLREMVEHAQIVGLGDDLPAATEKDLTRDLWTLDAHEIQLDFMRDAITEELARYDKDAVALGAGGAPAAVIAGRLNQPQAKPPGN